MERAVSEIMTETKFQRINLEAARQAFFSLPVQSFVGVVHSTMRDMDLLIGRNYQSEKNP